MARKIKIDNSILKRRAYKSGKRKIGKRKVREYILIVCEGTKTEPNYFKSIKSTFPNNTVETYDINIKGTGSSTLKIVDIAISLRNQSSAEYNKDFDEVWVVFDKDDFPESDFNNSIHKANSNGIKLAWSNEAFELWYILHFQYRNTGMSRDEYKKVLESEIRKSIGEKTGIKSEFKYLKNSSGMYRILKEFGDENQAIAWAKQLDATYSDEKFATHNPCTLVYKLIEKLNSCLKEVTIDNTE